MSDSFEDFPILSPGWYFDEDFEFLKMLTPKEKLKKFKGYLLELSNNLQKVSNTLLNAYETLDES